MDVDIKAKAKKLLMPKPAAPPPGAPTSAVDVLKDPLAKAAAGPADPLARSGGAFGDLSAAARSLEGPQTGAASPIVDNLTPTAAETATGDTNPYEGLKMAQGEKVVRNLWLVDGKMPWNAIEQYMGEKLPATVKEAGNKQLQGRTLDQPYVELIQKGDGLAVQVEDHEHLVVGPLMLKADYFAPKAAKDAEQEQEQDAPASEAVADARALGHDVGAAIKEASNARVGLDGLLQEAEALRSASGDADAPPTKAAQAGARTLSADGDRRVGGLKAAVAALQERLEEVEVAAANDPDAQAALKQASAELSQLVDQVAAAEAVNERLRELASSLKT